MSNTHSLDLEAGSSRYAHVADDAALSITGDISMEAWLKMESSPGDYVIMAKMATAGNNVSWTFDIDSADHLHMKFDSNGDNSTALSEADTDADAIPTGVWTHVAVTVDVSVPTTVFYINTVVVDHTQTSTSATAIVDKAADFTIGGRNHGGTPDGFYDGLIDECRLWSGIRTQDEIIANWKRQLTGAESGLVGYWKLDNDYTDETANANTLTKVNDPVFSTDTPDFGTLGDIQGHFNV